MDRYIGRKELLTPKTDVKGVAVRARRRYVLEHFGPRALEELIASLAGDAQRYLTETVLAASWYSMATLTELDCKLITGPMHDQADQMRTLGSEVAKYDLTTLYKLFFRLGSPSYVLSRVATAYSQYTRPGDMNPIETSNKRVLIDLTGVVVPFYMCAHLYRGWMESAVTMSGGRNVKSVHTACQHERQPTCRWEVTWD